MRSPLLIGVHGRAGAGKDETFLAIQKWAAGKGLITARGAYADKMKLSIARCFIPNATLEEALAFCNRLKQEDSYVEVTMFDGETIAVGGRKFHVNFGSNAHRDTLDYDIWVDQLIPFGRHEFKHPLQGEPKWHEPFISDDQMADIAVVTDVRLENEAQRIMDLGGEIWKVNRLSAVQLNLSSEQPLPEDMIDRHIYNNDGIPELQERVAKLMDEITDGGRK